MIDWKWQTKLIKKAHEIVDKLINEDDLYKKMQIINSINSLSVAKQVIRIAFIASGKFTKEDK